jgi:hypothetical protein
LWFYSFYLEQETVKEKKASSEWCAWVLFQIQKIAILSSISKIVNFVIEHFCYSWRVVYSSSAVAPANNSSVVEVKISISGQNVLAIGNCLCGEGLPGSVFLEQNRLPKRYIFKYSGHLFLIFH